MGYDGKLGANLEELYKAGKVEVKAIADSFGQARDDFGRVTCSLALWRHADLGLGAAGPNEEFGRLVRALESATGATHTTMSHVAHNLVVTAQTLARQDDDVRRAFVAAGGEL